jgi:hypothetical protein
VADETDFGISHEIAEAITDPDGNAWPNYVNGGFFGADLADECLFYRLLENIYYVLPSFVRLMDGKEYPVNSLYSNAGHGCASSPQ